MMERQCVGVIDDVGGITRFAGGLLEQRSGGMEIAVLQRFEGFFVAHARYCKEKWGRSPITPFFVVQKNGVIGLRPHFSFLRLGTAFAGLEALLGSALEAGFLFRAVDAAFLQDFVFSAHVSL